MNVYKMNDGRWLNLDMIVCAEENDNTVELQMLNDEKISICSEDWKNILASQERNQRLAWEVKRLSENITRLSSTIPHSVRVRL